MPECRLTSGAAGAALGWTSWLKNYFYISDYGQFAEVLSKVWVDK